MSRRFPLHRLLSPALAAVTWACAPLPVPVGGAVAVADAGVDSPEIAQEEDTATAPPDVAKALPAGPPIELVVNSTYMTKALDVIQTANKRLDIVQFESKTGDVIDILVGATIQAHARGVVVRVLLDDEIASNAVTVKKLKAAGVNAKLDSPNIRSHVKLLLSEQGYLVGSTNWSQTSITLNNETNVLVRDKTAHGKMATYFDSLWAKSQATAGIALGSSKTVAPYGDGGYEAAIQPLLEKAKTTLDICTYGMNIDTAYPDGPIMRSIGRLQAAIQRGVKVRVILDKSGAWAEDGNEFNEQAAKHLEAMGAEVRFDPVEVITHAKFLIADGSFVLGSNNWGYTGFEKNHEAGVRSSDPAATAALQTWFDKLWAKSTPVP